MDKVWVVNYCVEESCFGIRILVSEGYVDKK